MTDQNGIVPKVAFLINLAQADSPRPNRARLRHLVHLFHGHRVAATWAVADASQTRLLGDSLTSSTISEIALTVNNTWGGAEVSHSRFGNELSSRLAGLTKATGARPTLVVGDLGALRTRMTTLSEQGIRAICSSTSQATDTTNSRPLPCGLWQMSPSVRWPKRRLSRWLPSRSTSLKDLTTSAAEGAILVSVESAELERVSARGLQSFEKLLREVSWSASRSQMQIATLSEIVADLASSREVKPQRSILRTAA
jgi:hypothetical protein